MILDSWTVEYVGISPPKRVQIPHAWGLEVDVRWEGPAIYRTELEVPPSGGHLLFHGVSYEAVFLINGKEVERHRGIWDAIFVSLDSVRGQRIDLSVAVTKNGGESFPVNETLAGFIPYVYHTFGGIYKPVEWVQDLPVFEPAASDVTVDVAKIRRGHEPLYIKGALHWGWYPDLLHPNPPKEIFLPEISMAKELGFNLIKFCLWLPPHEFLAAMEENGLLAWIELPLWLPKLTEANESEALLEIERIVRQYAHHPNIALWTCGCELSKGVSSEFRSKLYELVSSLTNCPLIKDNSGGAEMYGGDPVEFGTFYDFHPYCDLPFYPEVLRSLGTGPRAQMPILLGEFNDYDDFRDPAKMQSDVPFWASSNESINAKGVRWQYDLPQLLANARGPLVQRDVLVSLSRQKSSFVRKRVFESVRSMEDIAGTVLTGWVDTPISTSGVLDDDRNPKWSGELPWNADNFAFLIPRRQPPWIRGGNRPGWQDTQCFFADEPQLIQIGLHSVKGWRGTTTVTLRNGHTGALVCEFDFQVDMAALTSKEIIQSPIELPAGNYRLELHGELLGSWEVTFVSRLSKLDEREANSTHKETKWTSSGWTESLHVFRELRTGIVQSGIVCLEHEGTLPMPFWRECIQHPLTAFGERILGLKDGLVRWHEFVAISPDCALDFDWVQKSLGPQFELEIDLMRVDTRTFQEHPLVITARSDEKTFVITTFRPFGGLGSQPNGWENPAGHLFLSRVAAQFSTNTSS